MALISVGIDHEHASLDLLERATVPEHEWAKMLRTLVSHRNIHEAVFVSTCLRTEVVAVIDRFHDAVDEITDDARRGDGSCRRPNFEDRLTVNFERDVATHLFSVAAGLKSVVPGEFEILGQLRRALDLAVEEQSAGSEVTDIFQRAVASGRRVRAETSISRGTTSFAQAAAAAAIDELGDELGGAERRRPRAPARWRAAWRGACSTRPRPLGGSRILNRTLERADVAAARARRRSRRRRRARRARANISPARGSSCAPSRSRRRCSRARALRRRPITPCVIVDLGMPRAVARDVAELATRAPHRHRRPAASASSGPSAIGARRSRRRRRSSTATSSGSSATSARAAPRSSCATCASTSTRSSRARSPAAGATSRV